MTWCINQFSLYKEVFTVLVRMFVGVCKAEIDVLIINIEDEYFIILRGLLNILIYDKYFISMIL